MPDSTRRNFLSLVAGAIAATISPAAGHPKDFVALDGMGSLTPPDLTAARGQADELWPWTVIDELVIEPNKPFDVDLFSEEGKWPSTLAIMSVGWGWREDTRLADCKQLLGTPDDDGVYVRLKADGFHVLSCAARYISGPRSLDFRTGAAPLSTELQPPIAAKSKFALQVSGNAMPLIQPVTLQFYLCGVIAMEEWLRGGVR